MCGLLFHFCQKELNFVISVSVHANNTGSFMFNGYTLLPQPRQKRTRSRYEEMGESSSNRQAEQGCRGRARGGGRGAQRGGERGGLRSDVVNDTKLMSGTRKC